MLVVLLSAALASAIAWQGLYSWQASRLIAFDPDIAKIWTVEGQWLGDLHPDAGIASLQSSLPDGLYRRPLITRGLWPYQAARWSGILIDPVPGVLLPRAPNNIMANSLEPGSATLRTAGEHFAIATLIGGAVTLATAATSFGLSAVLWAGPFQLTARHRWLIARASLNRAALAIPLLALAIAYGAYDRVELYGEPFPKGSSLIALVLFSLGFGILLGSLIRRRLQLTSRLRLGSCCACGYSIASAISTRCPECGTLEPASFTTARQVMVKGRWKQRSAWTAFAVALIGFVLWTPIEVFSTPGTTPAHRGAGIFLARWLTMRVSTAYDDRTGFKGFIHDIDRSDRSKNKYQLGD